MTGQRDLPLEVRARASYWAGQTAVIGYNDSQDTTLLEERMTLYARVGDRSGVIAATVLLGGAAEYQGDEDGAIARYQQAYILSGEINDTLLTVWSLINLADARYRHGDLAGSGDAVAEAERLVESTTSGILRVFVAVVSAQVALERGDIATASQVGATCLRLCRSNGDRLGFVSANVILAAVQHSWGQTERAIRLLGAADLIRESLGVRTPLNHGLQQRIVSATRAAVPPATFEQQWQTGRKLSMDAFAPPPVQPVVQKAKAPPRQTAPDSHGLTNREQEVLRLLISGLTDRQIADTLFISHRTTQVHVSSIFSKLGVNTRTAAATMALRLGFEGTSN